LVFYDNYYYYAKSNKVDADTQINVLDVTIIIESVYTCVDSANVLNLIG